MTEIKINVVLDMSTQLSSFLNKVFEGAKIHKALGADIKRAIEIERAVDPSTTEVTAHAGAFVAKEKKTEPEPEAVAEQPVADNGPTMPDLRNAMRKLWDGGKNKAVTDELIGKYNAKKLPDVAESDYAKLYEDMNEKIKELGL
jgi:hypothetical protein